MENEPTTSKLSTREFRELAARLASGWSQQDTELALSCFAQDAVYMEPPNIQLFVGHDQLRPYFAALQPGTFMIWHHLWFDEETQIGAGEYSFGEVGDRSVDHGVVVMEISNGVIALWREYQTKGPPTFASFLAVEGKEWEWHIGKYP